MPTIPSHLSAATAETWHSFQKAATEKGLQIHANTASRAALMTAFALSRFVALNAVRRPDLVVDLLASGDLDIDYGDTHLAPRFQRQLLLVSGAAPDADFQRLWRTLGQSEFDKHLRGFRLREMLRIAVRDLSGMADLDATLRDLSALADLCIQQALEFLFHRQCLEWGTPADEKGHRQELVVLGMGKLGAHELNFSSDVDLIFTYPKEGHTTNSSKTTTNDDFFVRLCRKLMQTIGAQTPEGFVFRVDARLRPFGDSGPLAMSFSRMEAYYEAHGREWERYALIKARAVAGDIEAGERLLKNLRPFVFRRYLDYNTFDSLRDMKQRIALEVQSKGLQDNIKLGPGGIREIEFFGQMFQLLKGGVQPELQARGIVPILRRLVAKHHIPAETGDDLLSAYAFLRCSENRIQAYADQQRHQLPLTEEERLLLALAMDFENWPGYLKALDHHRRKVHRHFNALLEAGGSAAATTDEENRTNDLIAVWQGVVEKDRACEILRMADYTDPPQALQLIHDLKSDAALRPMSPMGQERLTHIIPQLLRAAGQAARPQLVLQRLVNLIKSICRRTAYLALLCEYPAAIDHLTRLSEASPWIADLLSRHPVLLDELLDPRSLYSPPKREDLADELYSHMRSIDTQDFEHQLEALRIFKQTNTLRVAASDITNVLPLMQVSDRLSDIAEVVLNEVVDLSWRHLAAKHGIPVCRLEDRQCNQGFAVIAYGKLGGLELGYRSDLDLVFLHAAAPGETQGGPRPIDNAQFFARLGQRVLHILSAHTPAGILYEADMRLRPSGDSGMLVSHIDGFKDYQLNNAWTWEHQALIRARAIAGDQAIRERFEQIRMQVLALPREKPKLRQEVAAMRERLRQAQTSEETDNFDIKQGPGGIIDIEFLVQYLILGHAHRHPEIGRWTDNVRQLEALSSHTIIDRQTAFGLRRAYLILRAMGHRLNLKGLSAHIDPDRFEGLKNLVRRCWRLHLDKVK